MQALGLWSLIALFLTAVIIPLISLNSVTTSISGIFDNYNAFNGTRKVDNFTKESQIVLMVDAGSTGSRLHVYTFDKDQPSGNLVLSDEKFVKVIPGLSSYAGEPLEGAKSLDPLLQFALDHVPVEKRANTPISVKATAGLRLLGEHKSNQILQAVDAHLKEYPFKLDGISVLDGRDEGIYAWITVNYLLDTIGHGVQERVPTVAVFDLGGGSTQVVFEPDRSLHHPEQALIHGDHRYDLQFGQEEYILYQHSYLGYGLMEARKTVHQEVYINSTTSNPCIINGKSRLVTLNDRTEVNMTGVGYNGFEECLAITRSTLNIDEQCKFESCGFNGVHMPSLVDTFSNEDIYIFSYFYDRINPLDLGPIFTLDQLHNLTRKVCGGPSFWGQWKNKPEVLEELESRPEYCLDLCYMLSLLHDGYGIPLDREINVVKKINGNELGWCLGAAITLAGNMSTYEMDLP